MKKKHIKQLTEQSINNLEKWIDKNGFAGFDPYDVKAIPLIRKVTELGNKSFLFEIIRELVFELFLMFPNISRKLLDIKPQINAKAVGLLAKSYIDLYILKNDPLYLDKIQRCFDWLDENYSKNSVGKGWGYPFVWQSMYEIPANTPNGIVTTAVADAYWSMYKLTNEPKYLTVCKDICDFLANLPINKIAENQICFSYTPIFINHVHNLNLFVAEFLIKVGLEINNLEWVKLGENATNYTILNQLDDGSFDYNGPPEKPQNFVDNYHTAFVLRQLYSIWKLTNNQIYFDVLQKGYNYYIENLFENNTIPKFTKSRKYRIDIHSSAESINCLCELSPHFPQGVEMAQNIAEWTITTLQDKTGYFYHGIFKSRIIGKPFKSKIAFMRWGQAWMLKGLSNLSKTIN
jgi:rhamnogalacturonyl hydrolase YesR